ncbi:hypothetical protein NA56DRAFT_640692 [Hyaloscypha hepaticicola]|uniref:Roadblock/LAMTOR2 domain-containing protein n=1 Tax=Hyaloscypha hepaticicola TaxID=2082293 RepID=A0A2J6QNY3_9HELO|nr:hypothetical protein NA56DRAFT_640692 [Hyaloscypha hepaticicola]
MTSQLSSSGVEASSSNFSQTLERLSSKPGVIATLVLDRASSALLQSTGSFVFWSANTASPIGGSAPSAVPTSNSVTEASSTDSVSSFATTVMAYVNTSGEMIKHMNSSEDDLKLLRLRTKKHEIVIVPDSKFIFVVVHEISA